MKPPADFLASLKEGDLVAATVLSSKKLHLVTVVRHVTQDMVKGQSSPEHLLNLVDARVLCSARPRYYWRPTDALESWASEDRCWHCFAEHRRRGYQPAIKGWAKAEAEVEAKVRLPWGWQEVTPSGHPLDLPADAPDPDPDEDEAKVGAKRQEVSRWLRGTRYVRIVQNAKDKRFEVRYADLGDKPHEESWAFKGGWDHALLRAVAVMSLGGTWTGSTRAERLTMKDVAK